MLLTPNDCDKVPPMHAIIPNFFYKYFLFWQREKHIYFCCFAYVGYIGKYNINIQIKTTSKDDTK